MNVLKESKNRSAFIYPKSPVPSCARKKMIMVPVVSMVPIVKTRKATPKKARVERWESDDSGSTPHKAAPQKVRVERWESDDSGSTLPLSRDFSPERNPRVRFSNKVSVRSFISRPLTKADKAAVWYRKIDLVSFRNEIKDLAKESKVGKSLGKQPKQVETRGLETVLSEEATLAAMKRRQMTLKVVLEEQALQRKAGIYDTFRIRKEYIQVTRQAKLSAYALGKRDEKFVASLSDQTPSRPNRKVSMRLDDKSPAKPSRKFSFGLPSTRR